MQERGSPVPGLRNTGLETQDFRELSLNYVEIIPIWAVLLRTYLLNMHLTPTAPQRISVRVAQHQEIRQKQRDRLTHIFLVNSLKKKIWSVKVWQKLQGVKNG